MARAFLIALFASLCIFNTVAEAEHGENTWGNAGESVVVVNPTWRAMLNQGLAHHQGPLRQERAFITAADRKQTSPYIITAAHVVMKAKSIEIINFSGKKAEAVACF